MSKKQTKLFYAIPLLLIAALVAFASGADKTLFEGKSAYNETIIVTENDLGIRSLWFERNGAEQSAVKPGDPTHLDLEYTKVIPVALACVPKPKRVLIVGLGGGSIPSFLRAYYPDLTIDVVDIDPVVADVAKKYFGFREDASMKIHIQDGRKFIEDCKEPYDIIFLDAYGSDDIPYHLATEEFLQATRRALSPEGMVATNLMSSYINRLHDSMIRTYDEVFDEIHLLDVEHTGNEILLAFPREPKITRKVLAQWAETTSKEKNFAFDMGELVRYGYRSAKRDSERGEILKDKKD